MYEKAFRIVWYIFITGKCMCSVYFYILHVQTFSYKNAILKVHLQKCLKKAFRKASDIDCTNSMKIISTTVHEKTIKKNRNKFYAPAKNRVFGGQNKKFQKNVVDYGCCLAFGFLEIILVHIISCRIFINTYLDSKLEFII